MPQRAFGIFKICTTIQYRSRLPLHSMPSCCVRRKSASWHRIEIIKAFAFIKVKDSLPKSWPVTCPSSSSLHLANALASSFTWVTAPWWRPPEVFTANGRKTRPSHQQSSAVSLNFLFTAFSRASPARAAAPATLEGQRGPVTVTSMTLSFPFVQH